MCSEIAALESVGQRLSWCTRCSLWLNSREGSESVTSPPMALETSSSNDTRSSSTYTTQSVMHWNLDQVCLSDSKRIDAKESDGSFFMNVEKAKSLWPLLWIWLIMCSLLRQLFWSSERFGNYNTHCLIWSFVSSLTENFGGKSVCLSVLVLCNL